MKKLVVRDLGDLVRSRDMLRAIDAEPHLGEERCPVHRARTSVTATTPSTAATVCAMRATMAGSTASSSRCPTLRRGLTPDDQDGSGDDQANNRVRPLRPECHGNGSDENEQRGNAIGAGVDAVGFQRG